MEIIREIGKKGQVVIPRDIRRQINLEEGDEISFEVEGNKIIIEKKKRDAKEFLKNFMRYRMKGKSMSLKELKRIEEESYDLS